MALLVALTVTAIPGYAAQPVIYGSSTVSGLFNWGADWWTPYHEYRYAETVLYLDWTVDLSHPTYLNIVGMYSQTGGSCPVDVYINTIKMCSVHGQDPYYHGGWWNKATKTGGHYVGSFIADGTPGMSNVDVYSFLVESWMQSNPSLHYFVVLDQLDDGADVAVYQAWLGPPNTLGCQPEEPSAEVAVDIKPGSCPNPLNVKSKGLLPVAILGAEGFDVTDINVSTVELVGVSPVGSGVEDVSRPVADKQDPCDCTSEGADGHDDLTLKFKTKDIVKALGKVEDGQEIELTLTGALTDGTEFEASDCVRIIKKGKGGGQLGGAELGLPKVFALSQNNPNPFSRETTISFSLPATVRAKLRVYDVGGRVVATILDEHRGPGFYSVSWDGQAEDGKKVASGSYFVRLEAEGFEAASKMIVVQ